MLAILVYDVPASIAIYLRLRSYSVRILHWISQKGRRRSKEEVGNFILLYVWLILSPHVEWSDIRSGVPFNSVQVAQNKYTLSTQLAAIPPSTVTTSTSTPKLKQSAMVLVHEQRFVNVSNPYTEALWSPLLVLRWISSPNNINTTPAPGNFNHWIDLYESIFGNNSHPPHQ